MRKARNILLTVCLAAMCALSSCRIEPPLHLATDNVRIALASVVTDLSVVWGVDESWREQWLYGWDEEDLFKWGPMGYTEPSSFEARIYYHGKVETAPWTSLKAWTVYGHSFRSRYDAGYHDMLFWSNIDSPDGTQAVIFDESNPDEVHATTSGTRVSYATGPRGRAPEVRNNPEVFYGALEREVYVSDDPADFDYFDEEQDVWVKELHTTLDPMVYIYLVQVIVHNNRGRITGLNDNASVSSMASGVNVHTGRTHDDDVIVAYPMRLKSDIVARDGEHVDVMGGRLTTFGLCGMEAWRSSRSSAVYRGPRGDLRNHVRLSYLFNNATDTTFAYDVTEQMQRQAHGGVITIEIDGDTITIPATTGAEGAGFRPTVGEYADSVVHEFGM